MRRTLALFALLALFAPLPALALMVAAQPAAITKVYLPLVRCPSCTGRQPTGPTEPPAPTPIPGDERLEVIRLVNIERAKVGCPAAIAHPVLMQATQDWSDYMLRTFDYRHAPPGFYRNAPYFYDGAGIVENIGSGGNAEGIVEAWMLSSGHRINMLFCYSQDDPSYKPERMYEIGVGHADGYWTLALSGRLP